MKVIVISDTHGRLENCRTMLQKEKTINYLIHCGDIHDDAPFFQNQEFPIALVKGNCDWGRRLSEELIVELYGHRIMVCHGHRYSVRGTLMNLYYKAKQEQCDIVCFGHTHIPTIEKIDDVLILNPGSLSEPRQIGRIPTYLALTLEEGEEPKAEICKLK